MDQNGETPEKIGSIVERVRQALGGTSEHVLLDMLQDVPSLRVFLLGSTSEGGKAPGGTIQIGRGPQGVSVVLRIPALGVECRYDADNWSGTWECIELDLAHGTTKWVPDYKQRRKEEGSWEL